MKQGKVGHSAFREHLQVGRAKATAVAMVDHATLDDRVRAVNRAMQAGMMTLADAQQQLPRSLWGELQ